MRRRDPRWRVTYRLRGSSAHWMVRAPDKAEAIVRAKYERAGFDRERGYPSESDFELAFAVPYTTSDAMDDGTSPISWALLMGLPVLLMLALVGRAGAGGSVAYWAGFGFWLLQVMCAVGFAGYLLYGAVALVFAGVTVLRERGEVGEEE